MSSRIRICDQLLDHKLRASKWISFSVLFDKELFNSFLNDLGSCYFFKVGKVGSIDSFNLPKSELILLYDEFLETLKSGKKLDKTQFSWILTKDFEPLCLKPIRENQFILEIQKPVLRIGLNPVYVDEGLNKIVYQDHPDRSVFLGLKFSFPFFYQDPITLQPVEHYKDLTYPNTKMFRDLQSWFRGGVPSLKIKSKLSKNFYVPNTKIAASFFDSLENLEGLNAILQNFELEKIN